MLHVDRAKDLLVAVCYDRREAIQGCGPVLGNLGVDHLAAVGALRRGERAGAVLAHQAAIARRHRSKDRRQPNLLHAAFGNRSTKTLLLRLRFNATPSGRMVIGHQQWHHHCECSLTPHHLVCLRSLSHGPLAGLWINIDGYWSNQTSSMRKLLMMLLTIIVQFFTRGCQQ